MLWYCNGYAGGPEGIESADDIQAPVMAAQGENDDRTPGASANLEQKLENLETLSAGFTQTVTDQDGFEIQAMNGEMTVARPGYIYWETAPPHEQVLVSDGETLWLYDRDLEQVTVRPFLRDVADSPAMLLIGNVADIEDRYTVTRRDGEGGIRLFTLIPRDESTVYRRLELSFDGEVPVAMALQDSLGQQTRIEFADVVINQPVSPSLFQFDIPDGVDVLRDD